MTPGTELVAQRLALCRSLLESNVAVAISDPQAEPPEPFPAESACLTPRAVPKRRSEFAAGRAAAREAMQQLGLEPKPVLAAKNRAPVWPDGLLGSISHTADCAVAVVARQEEVSAIGIDVEQGTPLEEKLFGTICRESELAWLDTLPHPAMMAKVVFSAKEAAYKCQYPLSGRLFGFDGMELEIESEAGVFRAIFTENQPPFERGDVIPGRFAIGSGIIVTVAELRPQAGADKGCLHQ